jgi:hypothetical protein
MFALPPQKKLSFDVSIYSVNHKSHGGLAILFSAQTQHFHHPPLLPTQAVWQSSDQNSEVHRMFL